MSSSKKCTHCKRYGKAFYVGCSWCKICMAKLRKQWYLENRNYEIKKATVYYKKHKKHLLSKSALHRRKMRNAVLNRFKRKCKRCGFKDIRALQIDHVFGHGRQELKNMGNGSAQYLRRVLLDTKNRYQLLCANCNIIKYAKSKGR